VKPEVTNFLLEILKLLKKLEERASTKTVETQLVRRIVSFNEKKLDYYRSALRVDLDLCIKRLEMLKRFTSKPLPNFLGLY
jgi:hypothetical protein